MLLDAILIVSLFGPGTPVAQQLKISKPAIEVKQGFDFSEYETYAWKDSQQPLPNEANHLAMTFAIEDELRAKRLRKVDENPDLEVRFFTIVESEPRVTGYQGGSAVEPTNLRTMVRVDKRTTGRLTIELYDPSARTVVWKGTDSETITSESLDEALIREMVGRILAAYPPQP